MARTSPARSVTSWKSGSDLFKREMREVGSFPSVLDSESTNVPLSIDVELGVRIEILGLDDAPGPELDVEGVGVLEVLDLHGSNERSKNALCTVSPSCNSTTRRYLPSISSIGAQRRIRPSA